LWRDPSGRALLPEEAGGGCDLELLRDPAFDALLTGESHFDELPEVMAPLAAGSLPAVCHTITYGEG